MASLFGGGKKAEEEEKKEAVVADTNAAVKISQSKKNRIKETDK